MTTRNISDTNDKTGNGIIKTKNSKNVRTLAAKLIKKFGLWKACLEA
jgi:hypothetical protein